MTTASPCTRKWLGAASSPHRQFRMEKSGKSESATSCWQEMPLSFLSIRMVAGNPECMVRRFAASEK